MYYKKFFLSIILSNIICAYDGSSKISDLEIKMLSGEKTSIYKLLEDGPLLIDFWATWCAPCKNAMVHYNKMQKQYRDQGFKIIAINQDTPKSLSKVKSYIRSKKYSFLVGIDPNKKIGRKLNAVLLPTLILVDKEGGIVWRHQGFIPGDEKEIELQILNTLKKSNDVLN